MVDDLDVVLVSRRLRNLEFMAAQGAILVDAGSKRICQLIFAEDVQLVVVLCLDCLQQITVMRAESNSQILFFQE